MSQFSVELLCSFSLIVDVLLSERSSSSFVLQSRIHYLLRLKKVYLFQEELVSEELISRPKMSWKMVDPYLAQHMTNTQNVFILNIHSLSLV